VVGVVADVMLSDFDGSVIRSEYNQKLDMLGAYMLKNPDDYVVAGGFADSAGDEEYNLGLSERRAASEGRQHNRRVEIAVGGIN